MNFFFRGVCLTWALVLAGCTAGALAPGNSDFETGQVNDAEIVRLASGAFKTTPVPGWVLPEEDTPLGARAPLYFERFDVQFRFHTDGRSERFAHVVIGGTDGIKMQNEGQQFIPFDPRYERVELHRAHLLRNKESIDVLSRVRPRFLANDTVRNTIYQGRVNAVFQIPDFRTGDRLELAWTVSSHNPLLGGLVSSLEAWSLTVAPIWSRRIAYHFPETMLVRVSIQPNDDARRTRQGRIQREETTTDGVRRIVFRDHHLPLLPTENDGASGTLQNDYIQATSFADWAAVAAWGDALFGQAPAPEGGEYRQRVATLRAIDGDAARVAAALRWVQREIRYVSMSFGENSHRPHSPDETLARRYGDCKDVTLLLVRLLRDLGLEARPALMSTLNGRLPPRLSAAPTPFNHAVAVVWVDGHMHVLDGTLRGQISRLNRLGSPHGGGDLLILGGPNAGFTRVPYTGNAEDRTLRIVETMVVKDDGATGELTRSTIYRGMLAEAQRRRIQSVDTETLRRDYLYETSKQYPDSEVLKGPAIQDQKELNEVRISVSYKVPDPVKRSGPNWRHEYGNSAFMTRLPRVLSSKREIPLGLPFNAQHVHFEHTLEVPDTFRIDEEAFEEQVVCPELKASIRRERPTPTRLVDRLDFELIADEIPRAAIADYRRAMQPLFDFRSEVRLKRDTRR